MPSAAALQGSPIAAEAVRDTLARIIASGDYARGVRETLLARFLRWLGDLWVRIIEFGGDSPVVRWSAIVVLALMVAAMVARLLWAWVLERRALARLEQAAGTRAGTGEDPLVAARRAAERGDHTAAIHLLYRALLMRLASRERLRLHPAKTAGDYARELRSRGSDAWSPFREFARAYERAVYGSPTLDAGAWEHLHALAAPLLA